MVKKVNTGISVPESLLEDFDAVLLQKRARGEIAANASRSAVIAELMQEFVDENRDALPDDSGKQTPATTV